MKRKTALPELLAPAGSPEALYAAIAAGADAVYVGGRHSARAFARNFDETELLDGIRYAHLHGKKIYIALNTLLFDREMSEALSYAARVAAMGVDAAIVADLGLMSLLRRELPELPIHASTQCFIHNRATADFYASQGAERIVAARECSLDSIRDLCENAFAEVEVFLHGALCVSHSGQCLFSSLVGGRSGNRGECAQPCRLPYGKGHPLSLSDLALAGHIPALIGAGVSSLKIEGRMKSPSYVAGVTGIYRRLLDEKRAATPDEWQALSRLFSRSGFTDKYLTARHSEPMTGIRTAEDKAESRLCEESFTKERVSIRGSVEILKNSPSRLSFSLGQKTVTVTGQSAEDARSAPLDAAEVVRRLTKLGDTPFRLADGDLAVRLDEGVFLPAGALNALRRDGVAALLGGDAAPRPVAYRKSPIARPLAPHRVAVCYAAEQARVCERSGFFDRVYLSLVAAHEAHYYPKGVLLPPVIMEAERAEVEAMLAAAKAGGAEHAICDAYGQIATVRATGLVPIGGFRLNVTNRETVFALQSMGIEDITLSPELSAVRVRDLGGRCITYGRIPLMLTERCFIKENFGCERCGSAALTDRRGVRFPMMREFRHRNLILNSVPTYLADRPAILAEAGSPRECYLFTIEKEKEIATVIAASRAGKPLAGAVRRLPQ